MDIFTHAALPFALFAVLRRRRAEALAAGLGAAMPDMDVLFTWVARLDDSLYAFTHRGWSHTLWGAPLLALLGLAVVSRPRWAARWPRLAGFRLDPLTAAAAGFGALTHLALDALTISGVPALWPLSAQRFSLGLFYFSALYMLPVSAYVIWRLARGTLTDQALRRGAALLVTLLVLGGAVRAAALPRDAPPGAVVQPTPNDVHWLVATPVPGGWDVEDHTWVGAPQRHVFIGNATPAAAPAVARAQALGAYVAWAWVNPAPVVNATAVPGGWRVDFRDAMALHRDATGNPLAGLLHEPEPLSIEVVGSQATVVHRPWWYGLG